MILLYGLSLIGLDAQINFIFENNTLIIGGALQYHIYLHNRCSDFASLEPINQLYALESDMYLLFFNSHPLDLCNS